MTGRKGASAGVTVITRSLFYQLRLATKAIFTTLQRGRTSLHAVLEAPTKNCFTKRKVKSKKQNKKKQQQKPKTYFFNPFTAIMSFLKRPIKERNFKRYCLLFAPARERIFIKAYSIESKSVTGSEKEKQQCLLVRPCILQPKNVIGWVQKNKCEGVKKKRGGGLEGKWGGGG